MGFFDQLGRTMSGMNQGKQGGVGGAIRNAASNIGAKKQRFTFAALPKNVAELQALPEAALTTPFMAAALAVLACCRYEESPQDAIDMINFLKGPQPLSAYEIQFLRDRLLGKSHVPMSFFEGTNPQNSYTPSMPYTICVEDYAYSYTTAGYAMMQLRSSGADSPRQIKLRQKGNQWFWWENYLLSDIRIPASQDPWA